MKIWLRFLLLRFHLKKTLHKLKKGIKIKKLSDIYSAGLHFQTSYMFTWISEESLIVFILFQKEKISIMVSIRINQKINFNIKI